MANILFVGHEASLTGAPFTQLHLMRWIKENTSHDLILLLINGGDLVPEFEKLAKVFILNMGKPTFSIANRVLLKLNSLTDYHRKLIFNKIAAEKPQLVFANTAITLGLGVELKRLLGVKLILNVHELESTFYHYSIENFVQNSVLVDSFIPGSYAVKKYYQSFCPLKEDNIHVIYDFIGSELAGSTTAESLRTQHNIPPGAKVVGAIASLIWRKGADVFIRVAQELLRQDPNIYFVWVGGSPHSYQFKEIIRDIELLGLSNRVLFVGNKSDLRGYYELFDVFLLTSREDPFPLVCLEAGLAGKPIICFELAGGMPEFVRDDAGFVVPYLDVDLMASKTLLLLNNKVLAVQKGEVAKQRVVKNHTITTIGPAMYEQITKCLSTGG